MLKVMRLTYREICAISRIDVWNLHQHYAIEENTDRGNEYIVSYTYGSLGSYLLIFQYSKGI